MQRWWIAIVAVVGIGLAILLFPRPDTGQDIPDVAPTNADAGDFDGDGTPEPRLRKKGRKNNSVMEGHKEGLERLAEIRSRPDAVHAGKLTAPWSTIRYALMKANDDEANALADDIAKVLAPLQSARRDPTTGKPFEEMETTLKDLEQRVAASKWAEEESVSIALARHREILEEYHAAVAEGTAEEGTP
ncbi:MAG: hypothetical protein KTR31_39615 [Myxococcales bacterium]|nr:hypothetical protein [Myxococcales bacterium]